MGTSEHHGHLVKPVGIIKTPFREKFGIPRQAKLATAARGTIVLQGDCNHPDAVRGLQAFSHLWLIFLFSNNLDKGWKPLVRPPRLGGNQRTGVFASRSGFRPNGIGQSVVKLEDIEINQNKQVLIHVSALDLLDQTPLLDIKPYIAYADSIADAAAGFVDCAPLANLEVKFSDAAENAVTRFASEHRPNLRQLIIQVLVQDPRPAYQEQPEREYGMRLFDLNIRFTVSQNTLSVLSVNLNSKVK